MNHRKQTPQRFLLAAAVGGMLFPALARASDSPAFIGVQLAQDAKTTPDLDTPDFNLSPAVVAHNMNDKKDSSDQSSSSSYNPATAVDPPMLTMAGGASRIHGFGDFRIATQYITPRGLVAEEDSPQFQALFGLVFDIYSSDGFISDVSIIGGTWGDYNTHPDKSVVTGADIWVEQDFFGGFDVKFAQKWDFAYTIQAWTFPDLTDNNNEIDPSTEYNMDFKFSFDDTEYLKDWAMHPYMDVFWNFAGEDSPVVSQATLGRNDHTFYVEFGISPSYTFKGINDFPITFTMPSYFSVGDSSFWGESPAGNRSNFGVASTGLKISAPIKFIPADLGNWTAYIGVTYMHTCNPALSYINSGTGADTNLVLGYAGVGFGF